MPTDQESAPARWKVMVAIWAVAGLLILLHTAVVREYVGLLDAQGLRGADGARTPLRQVIPARHADTQMWVRHVLDGEESGAGRVRYTTVDNAPVGREVHWSSAFGWLLRAAAALQQTAGGSPKRETALERALLWFNAPLFLAVIVLSSGWTARRYGLWAGALLALALVGHERFREGFEPAYVDHHGLVNAGLLGLALGAAGMGFGWWRPKVRPDSALLPEGREPARRGAIVSALSGAFALWLSASSSVWVIAVVGLGGLATALWHGRAAQANGARFDPGIWRLWGRVGAAASVVCYLIEYAPSHLGWRLEVNHPLYSLAWWGGAELVATLGAAWVAGPPTGGGRRIGVRQLILPAVALAGPPIAIAVGGAATFLPADPFVAELRHFVAESRSLPAMVREFGLRSVGYDLASALLLIPAAWVLRRHRGETRLVLGALAIGTAVFLIAAFLVVRWWVVASVMEITLLIWLVAALAGEVPRRRTVAVAAAGVLLLLPTVWRIARDARANRQRVVAAVDLFQPLYRDLAATLRATQPEGRIILLASPNVSAGVSYFGRFQSVGTLFWENAPGLRAAAEILCAENDEAARRLLEARGVTHLVLLSGAPFVREYFSLLHSARSLDEAKRTFGWRLLGDPAACPRWLQPVPYRPPPELAGVGGVANVFKVVPGQTEDVRRFHAALTLAVRGEAAAAEQVFLSALAFVPKNAQASFCSFAGESAYEYGAHAVALRMLRRAGDGDDVGNLTAWILATSTDAAVRNGPAALALVQPLGPRRPGDPVVMSTLAAAYAELGRFDEAVTTAEQALNALRVRSGDAASQSLLARRLEAYRARQPWRQ